MYGSGALTVGKIIRQGAPLILQGQLLEPHMCFAVVAGVTELGSVGRPPVGDQILASFVFATILGFVLHSVRSDKSKTSDFGGTYVVNPWFLDRGTLKIKFLSIMSPAGAGESENAVDTVIDSVDKLFGSTERVPVVGGWREYLKP